MNSVNFGFIISIAALFHSMFRMVIHLIKSHIGFETTVDDVQGFHHQMKMTQLLLPLKHIHQSSTRINHSIADSESESTSFLNRSLSRLLLLDLLNEAIKENENLRVSNTNAIEYSFSTLNFSKFLVKIMQDDDSSNQLSRYQCQLTSIEVRAFIESFATVITVLVYILYFLAYHPDCEDICRKEIERSMPKKAGDVIDPSVLSYCNAVISETLRLYRTVDAPIHLGQLSRPNTINAYFLFNSKDLRNEEQGCRFEYKHVAEFSPEQWIEPMSKVSSEFVVNDLVMRLDYQSKQGIRRTHHVNSLHGTRGGSEDEAIRQALLFAFVSLLSQVSLDEVNAQLNCSPDGIIHGSVIMISKRQEQ